MAVAAPKRRSSVAPAPAPSRTTAPKRKKAAPPRRAPAKAAPRARAAAAPATVPTRRAPARAPQRARPKSKPKRSTGGQLIPLAVGRTAATVRHLPDSGLIVRMTRGRAWIAVLGVLLVGIVALNVVTLSFAASSGKIDEQASALEEEISALKNRAAVKLSPSRIRSEAAVQGLTLSSAADPSVIQYSPQDVQTAAQRLAAAG